MSFMSGEVLASEESIPSIFGVGLDRFLFAGGDSSLLFSDLSSSLLAWLRSFSDLDEFPSSSDDVELKLWGFISFFP